jgi:hypothetical protein
VAERSSDLEFDPLGPLDVADRVFTFGGSKDVLAALFRARRDS